ncbi:MAG: beta-ketoacyl synthase N-terminal-like domain-containing protein [Gammaproteobacteria bacterium]|nr:beta-ketoacyl synthase N-terminal-like domain-containing protein [Gammaproteobacteria bacterium]
MSAPSVYITGMGMLTAAGHSVEDNWASLLNGTSHLRPITGWDLSGWPCQLGGELTSFEPAKQLPDRKLLKIISRQDTFGLFAAQGAIQHSGLLDHRETLPTQEAFNDMTGIYVGSPGNKYLQQYDFLPLLAKTGDDMPAFATHLSEEVHPMWLLRILPNNVLAYTGIQYGFKGPNHNIANHAIGGSQALIEAFHAIQSGEIDRAVVVAYDLGLEPQALFYYDKLGLLSPDGLKPFDEAHNGTVLADGAAAIVLESKASAQARQATCFAELRAAASQTECAGLFGLTEGGAPLEALMQHVMHKAQCTPEQLAFTIAHGNGSKGSDHAEAAALTRFLAATPSPVSAFKWSMGHTLVASGLVDTILATLALNKRTLPGIAPLTTPHHSAQSLDLSPHTRQIDHGDVALIINRGFASMNACIAIKACDPFLH